VIRTATSEDLELVRGLWRAFGAEVPDLSWRDDDSADDLAQIEQALGDGGVLLADDGAGIAVISMDGEREGSLDLLYVRPDARGRGSARELVREAAAQLRGRGAEAVELHVLETSTAARTLYQRLGFTTVERIVAAPVDLLVQAGEGGPTFGAVHVQTDDSGLVERNVQKVLPRLGHSESSEVTGPADGWVRVRSDLTDGDPAKLQALAKELSYTNGGVTLALGVEDGVVVRYTLFDRGSSVDEYASVPEYRGALPPGDVIALGANPTVVARLTGADPHRVREIAQTATSPGELPPAQDLYEQIATLMGVKA
jgi:ribosomal protein S18 acetylase RimI-like enzyme